MDEPKPNQRRSPRQARSRATWEAIVEAAAQILERQGPEGLTTNDVAGRAGVSIGTLYQYFPDKQAILLAAARREAVALPGRPQALLQALIAALESLGRLGAGVANPTACTSADVARPKPRRRSSLTCQYADLVQEWLAELVRPATPTLIPIPIRPIARRPPR